MEILHELALKFAQTIPNLTGAFLLIIAGIILSKLVSKFMQKMLKALNIDRFGEKLNDIDLVRKSGIDIKINEVVSKVTHHLLLLK